MDQPKEGVRESTFQNLDVTNPDAAWSILSKLQQFQRVPTCTSTSTEHEKNAGDFTRIACMSDTHGKHRKVFVPKCNVLVHAGDFTKSGEHKIIQDVGAFFQEIVDNGTAEKVLCIAGNHDLTFQEETYRENWKVFHPISGMPDTKALKNDFKQSCIYLEDESLLDDDHERNNSNGNGNGNDNGNGNGNGSFGPPPAYCDTKLMNALTCKYMATVLPPSISTYAVCPGFCRSSLGRSVSFPFYQKIMFAPIMLLIQRSAFQGAQNIVFAAAEDKQKLQSGVMYKDGEVAKEQMDYVNELGDDLPKELFELSEELLKESEHESESENEGTSTT